MRPWRWRWGGALAVGVIGLTAWWWLPPLLGIVGGYWRLEWADKDQIASVIGMGISGLALLSSIGLGVAQMRQAHRLADPARGQLDPGQDADRRLRAHLGPTRRRLLRMTAVSPRQARVHVAIPAPPQPSGAARRTWWARWRTSEPALDPDLPLFVERDLWPDILSWTRQARRDGGFLLLVGTSSVGKTRLLFEAARRELGDFRAVVPDLGDGGLVNALAADGPREPLIVWLDELQRFLPGPYFAIDQATGHIPLTATAIRHLLNRDTPVVVLGTLWPAYVHQLRATDPDTHVTRPRYPQAVDILNLVTHNLTISTFSRTERETAARLAGQDSRLATAVANQDYNVTETLAGVPTILRRYHEALPEHQAVIHAAVDARRMGIQGPLTADLLRAAARGYLTSVHTNDTWFDLALHTLTRSDRRDDAATAPLITLASPEQRAVHGYTVTDYLLQHLLRKRRSTLLSDPTWRALEHHTHNHDDLTRLADNAHRRMQYALATRIYRAQADAGNSAVTRRLVQLLFERGKVDELRALADAGNSAATRRLAWLLAEQGKVDEAEAVLRPLVDAGDGLAANSLATLLAEQGKVDEAEAVRAPMAEAEATRRLVQLLFEQGKVDELRALAEAGNSAAKVGSVAALSHVMVVAMLARLLARQGKVDELRALAEADNSAATNPLAWLLADQGKVDEAEAVLRPLPDPGNFLAATPMVELLAQQGKVDELRALAEAGNAAAAWSLVAPLIEEGKVEELWQEVHAGTAHAAMVALALSEQGSMAGVDVEQLRRWGLNADGDVAQPW